MLKIIAIVSALVAGLGLVAYQYVQAKKTVVSAPDAESSVDPGTEALPHDSTPLLPAPEATESDPSPQVENPPKRPRIKASRGHFELYVPYTEQDAYEKAASEDGWFDEERAQKIKEVFTEPGSPAAENVKVYSVTCRAKVCTMESSSKSGDADLFQNTVVDTVRTHPWIGNKIDVTTGDGLDATFVFFHEIPK